ncbi:MAG TPA: hypothetical protein VI956_02090 [Nitrospirota bacterium]|nr:hypothetical protein [Nitrospirota bacterium]
MKYRAIVKKNLKGHLTKIFMEGILRNAIGMRFDKPTPVRGNVSYRLSRIMTEGDGETLPCGRLENVYGNEKADPD